MPGRFITHMCLDLLMLILPHTVSALPNTEYEDQDLGLISASAIALGERSSEDKARKARAAILRNTCNHLLSCTAGGLKRLGDFSYSRFSLVCPQIFLLQAKNTGGPVRERDTFN